MKRFSCRSRSKAVQLQVPHRGGPVAGLAPKWSSRRSRSEVVELQVPQRSGAVASPAVKRCRCYTHAKAKHANKTTVSTLQQNEVFCERSTYVPFMLAGQRLGSRRAGTDGRTGGRTGERTGWTDGPTDGQTNGREDGREDGRTGGRTDGRRDGLTVPPGLSLQV